MSLVPQRRLVWGSGAQNRCLSRPRGRGSWGTLCTRPRRPTTAAVCADNGAAGRSWSPRPRPPTGSAVAGSRPAHEALLPARPRNRAPSPSLCAGSCPRLFSVTTEAAGVWVAPRGSGKSGRLCGRDAVPRTGRLRVPSSQNQRGRQRRSESLSTETHLPLPGIVPEKAAGRQPDVHRVATGRLRPLAPVTVPSGTGSLLRQAGATGQSALPAALATSHETSRVGGRWAPVLGRRGRLRLGTAAGPGWRGRGGAV